MLATNEMFLLDVVSSQLVVIFLTSVLSIMGDDDGKVRCDFYSRLGIPGFLPGIQSAAGVVLSES